MTTTVEFGVLLDAPLREAWPHEALSFTPWLAQNLDRISAAVGIPLELDGIEVPVGRFSADILATNPLDQSKVLIENQLEHGDHSHLGQILTYLTGLGAHTVIWVAQDFREEHLSALRWLNQHTEQPFAFIAVRLRVVRIGASPYAPLFEVIEKPNGWDRTVQETIKKEGGGQLSELGNHRRAFWDHYATRHPTSASDNRMGGGAAIWRAIPGTDLVVSRWVGGEKVGIFVRGARGAEDGAVAAALGDQIDAVAELLATSVGSPRYALDKRMSIDTTQPENWDAAIDWLNAETERYVSVLTTAFETPDNG